MKMIRAALVFASALFLLTTVFLFAAKPAKPADAKTKDPEAMMAKSNKVTLRDLPQSVRTGGTAIPATETKILPPKDEQFNLHVNEHTLILQALDETQPANQFVSYSRAQIVVLGLPG